MADDQCPVYCDQEIFQLGRPVMALDANSPTVHSLVRRLVQKTGARLDYHYDGTYAQVLHLGDEESRSRVESAIDELMPILGRYLLQRFSPQDVGLYRAGVSSVPPKSISGTWIKQVEDLIKTG